MIKGLSHPHLSNCIRKYVHNLNVVRLCINKLYMPKIETFLLKGIKRIHNEIIWARLGIVTHLSYYRKHAKGCLMCPPLGGADFCDLATVTFNNDRVVEYQIRSLKLFFKYPFRYTVFDNSSNEAAAKRIQGICKKYQVGYIKLPPQVFLPKGFGSYSHGIAINYAVNHYIKNGGARYFGLLDHDIFLIRDFDISCHLDPHQFFYGCKHGFYIWPGLFFMTMTKIIKKGVDFRPSLHLRGDTGACNYYHHFFHIKWEDYLLAKDVHHLLDDKDDDIFRNGYSIIDNCWLHCWNASDYMHKGVSNKMNRIYDLLDHIFKDKEDERTN